MPRGSPPRWPIEAGQRRELGLDVGEVSGGGFAREGSPIQKTSHTEGHIGEKGCQGHGTCTVGRVVQCQTCTGGRGGRSRHTEDTRKVLMDKKRRPPVAREPIATDILGRTPDVPLDFDVDRLLKNLREARKGSAAGPSGA